MTSRQRYSSFNCRARGQTEYSLERNTLRSSSKASHSNNVCWIVSDSRDSQQGHCALRTSCVRLLELRRSWQPNRNFVFNLRPSRRDEGHVLSKYPGRPNRSFWTHVLIRLDSESDPGLLGIAELPINHITTTRAAPPPSACRGARGPTRRSSAPAPRRPAAR